MIGQMTNKVIEGYAITKEEAMGLFDIPVDVLAEKAHEIRTALCGEAFDMCTIINGKSGKCPEDCKYCAQSGHYNTQVEVFPLLEKDKIVEDALRNEEKGVHRYSVVTSGKCASEKRWKNYVKSMVLYVKGAISNFALPTDCWDMKAF